MAPREYSRHDRKNPDEYKEYLKALAEDCKVILRSMESNDVSQAYARWLAANKDWKELQPVSNIATAANTQYRLPATREIQLTQDEFKNSSKNLAEIISNTIAALSLKHSIPEISDLLGYYWKSSKHKPVDLGRLENAHLLDEQGGIDFNLMDFRLELANFINAISQKKI